MKTKLSLLLFLFLTISAVNAQKVIPETDCNSAILKKIMTNAGIEVVVSQPKYIQIVQDSNLKINTYIDINPENQWLVFNVENSLKDEVTPSKAKELVLNINAQTNLIRASYNEEKNSVAFTYYFVTKGGFTEDGLLSALDLFKLTYIYAITTVDKNELFK